MADTVPDIEIMDTMAVEALTGVKAGTLRYWRATEQGPPWFRLGERRIVYLRSDLERWLQAQIDRSYTDPGATGASPVKKPVITKDAPSTTRRRRRRTGK